jgi:hypothetical protein
MDARRGERRHRNVPAGVSAARLLRRGPRSASPSGGHGPVRRARRAEHRRHGDRGRPCPRQNRTFTLVSPMHKHRVGQSRAGSRQERPATPRSLEYARRPADMAQSAAVRALSASRADQVLLAAGYSVRGGFSERCEISSSFDSDSITVEGNLRCRRRVFGEPTLCGRVPPACGVCGRDGAPPFSGLGRAGRRSPGR